MSSGFRLRNGGWFSKIERSRGLEDTLTTIASRITGLQRPKKLLTASHSVYTSLPTFNTLSVCHYSYISKHYHGTLIPRCLSKIPDGYGP